MIRYIKPHLTVLIIISFFYSCSSKKKDDKKVRNDTNISQSDVENKSNKEKIKVSLTECTKNAVYYLDEVDITTYDSVTTQYFHEVMDYTTEEALELQKEIESLKSFMESNVENENDSIVELYYKKKTGLSKFKKEITGYVYVHTFLNNSDTLSALILANANCTKATAIKVRTISDIDPSLYASQIRKINK